MRRIFAPVELVPIRVELIGETEMCPKVRSSAVRIALNILHEYGLLVVDSPAVRGLAVFNLQ